MDTSIRVSEYEESGRGVRRRRWNEFPRASKAPEELDGPLHSEVRGHRSVGPSAGAVPTALDAVENLLL